MEAVEVAEASAASTKGRAERVSSEAEARRRAAEAAATAAANAFAAEREALKVRGLEKGVCFRMFKC